MQKLLEAAQAPACMQLLLPLLLLLLPLLLLLSLFAAAVTVGMDRA